MAKLRIFLCGYYGFGNTGDEMILAGVHRALGTVFDDFELHVTSGGTPLEVPGVPVPWQDVEGIRRAVRTADLVVVGGGGLFQDYWGVDRQTLGTPRHHGVTFYAWPLLLAAEYGVPSMVWGVGVGPLATEEGRTLVREGLTAASWVSVRDRASAALLSELGLTPGSVDVVPDAAWAAPRRHWDRAGVLAAMGLPPSHRLVALALRRWPDQEVPQREVVMEGLRRLARRFPLGVAWVPFHVGSGRDDDQAAAQELAAALVDVVPGWVVPARWRFAQRFWLCAAADLTVGMRLHACLAALRGGRLPVAVAYDPKVAALLQEHGDPHGAREPEAWSAEELVEVMAGRLALPADSGEAEKWERESLRPARVARQLVEGSRRRTGGNGQPDSPRGVAMELTQAALQRRLENLLASHRNPREVVLFLPSVYWRTEVFQRPNQLALALARAGCLVFFWEPPTSQDFGPGFHRVERRLYVANVPPEVWGYLSNPVVVALAYNRRWGETLGTHRLVYDVIDHLDVFPGGSAAWAGEHGRLVGEATVVTAVSRPLWEEVSRQRGDAVYLPNAADPQAIQRFLAAASPQEGASSSPEGLAIGYFGSFAAWLDYDLLAAIIEAFPHATLRLAGPDLDGSLRESGLLELSPVQYRGPLPQAHLYSYFRDLDVAIIPFRVNPITAAVSPLKLYEYLAMDLPVVSTDLPECRGVPGVWVARSREEFLQLLPQVREGARAAAMVAARRKFAEENTWAKRAELLLAHVAAASARPAAHGDPDQLARRLARTAAERDQQAEEAARHRAEAEHWQGQYHQLGGWYEERQREVERLIREGEEQAARAAALEREVGALTEQLGERQREVERLVGEQREHVARITALEGELAALVERYGERQREVERLHAALQGITSTRWFALASAYWRWVQRWRRRGGAGSPPPPPAGGSPPANPAAVAQPQATGQGGGASHELASAEPEGGPIQAPEGLEDYIVFPIIDWDFRFQRPQQLAVALAQRGHRVFYCRTSFRRGGAAAEVTPKAPNVWEVSLRGPNRNVYRDPLKAEDTDQLAESLEALRRQQGLGACALLVELPFWWPLARTLRQRWAAPVVYDCMDYHPGFSTNEAAMLQQEEDLVVGADLVIASSAFLAEQLGGRARRLLRLPNACDFDHFARVPWRPPADPPTVGYYGAIAEWFDAPLVGELARVRPHWRFLLVGSTYTCDTGPLRGLANVTLAGEQPYAELPHWIASMDVLMIPFRRSPLTEATNPVKFYEIMAAGKPLVAVPLPELVEHGDLVAFAESAEEFAVRLEEQLAQEREERSQARRAFARTQTWVARAEALVPAVRQAFPLASVVVVTFNNLALTRACLASVLERTEWPHFEVIVVDNGSTDGTPDYLRDLAAADGRVRVILNGHNRGFAAANNQGLALAEGEYLVLLNNDTVVVRGWLRGLIRHLASHPQWGLVGPVTNWIGNEAQIPVGYRTLEELPAWAARHCRENAGKYFPIPVLAMFCVAMRRETFRLVGELDERFGAGMFEDDDYALRVRQAGLEVVCVEDVFVHHEGRAAFRRMDEAAYRQLFETNRRSFEEKWGRAWTPHRYRTQG